MNVTDTASAVVSLLLDLQVGGVTRFSVRKNGLVNVRNELYWQNDSGSINYGYFSLGLLQLQNTGTFAWSATSNGGASGDLFLARDAADTLAQRRTTNAQTFRLYNTFTDASNYERAKMEWASNVLRIGTEKAGTGTARALEFQTDGTTRLTIATDGVVVAPNRIETGNDLQAGVSRALFFGASGAGNGRLQNSGDGVFGLYSRAAAEIRFQFGGTTSSFPAIKRSTTSLQARLADDSAFTNIQGKLTTETAYTAGAPTAAGYLVLYDSNGTAYKVPAEAL